MRCTYAAWPTRQLGEDRSHSTSSILRGNSGSASLPTRDAQASRDVVRLFTDATISVALEVTASRKFPRSAITTGGETASREVVDGLNFRLPRGEPKVVFVREAGSVERVSQLFDARVMSDSEAYAGEIELVARCLEHDQQAVARLQQQYGRALIGFLVSAGATETVARDIVGSLWSDCAVGDTTHSPRLKRYHGKCALITWLKTVAMNELIDLKRREARFRKIEALAISEGIGVDAYQALSPGVMTLAHTEQPLLALMETALSSAMKKCSSQAFVLLRLVYLNGLTQREAARLWGWHESKVSRTLDSALKLIASETLYAMKAADPWIEVGWDDFVELCNCTDRLFCG